MAGRESLIAQGLWDFERDRPSPRAPDEPEAVERVAKAIYERSLTGTVAMVMWEGFPAEYRDMFYAQARAAIEVHEAALVDAGLVIVPREPTKEMWKAAPKLSEWNHNFVPPRLEPTFAVTVGSVYRAMIAAALKGAS